MMMNHSFRENLDESYSTHVRRVVLLLKEKTNALRWNYGHDFGRKRSRS